MRSLAFVGISETQEEIPLFEIAYFQGPTPTITWRNLRQIQVGLKVVVVVVAAAAAVVKVVL